MANYPYAPPPPAPTAAPASSYPSYGAGQGYPQMPARGGHAAVNGGRARGHHQGPGRSEYGNYYQQQDYSTPNAAPYGSPQPGAYWQGSQPMTHPQQSVSPMPPSNYPPNYAPPQGYAPPQPSQGYQPPYPNPSSRPSYGPPYGQPPSDYASPSPWAEQGQSYASYGGSRGGRGGFQSDRGGYKSDPSVGTPPLRMGFDQRNDRPSQPSSGYGQPYPPTTHHQSTPHQPAPYPQAPYSYPSVPATPYSGSSHSHYGSHNRGGGREGFTHTGRGGRAGGDKFRNRDRPHNGYQNNHQKSDAASSSKKKKRKTNTLGLTPGDDESEDVAVDEEKQLVETLGGDAPTVPDMAAWLAERRANYPTKARIAAKKAAGLTSTAGQEDANNAATTTKVDKAEEEVARMRKQLAKAERKLEKRKRAETDEGDEMRAESVSSEEQSEDEKPEVLPSGKLADTFLPPPPMTRADPTNHCKYYSTGGTCGKKDKCRFVHDPAKREKALQEITRNGGKMTLSQRLTLNDKMHDNTELVKTILAMRSNGRLHDPQNPHIRANRKAREDAAIAAVSTTLPTTAGVANLPPNPHKKTSKSPTRKKSVTVKTEWKVDPCYSQLWLGGYGSHLKGLGLRELAPYPPDRSESPPL